MRKRRKRKAINKKIYCVYCGTINNKKDIECKKCNKKLNPKDNLFIDYLKEHIKDDIKGNFEDKTFDIIKKFIISHLYGTTFTATLIFTVVSGLIISNIDNYIEEVERKPQFLLNACNFEKVESLKYMCDEGYVLNDKKCIKEELTEPTEKLFCQEGYTLNSNYCISNLNYQKETRQECIMPQGNSNILSVQVMDGECMAEVCSGWTDGVCSAGGWEPINFTVFENCPAGTTLINGVCKTTTTVQTEKICNEGNLEDNKCKTIIEKEATLGCDEGYVLNKECNICVGE